MPTTNRGSRHVSWWVTGLLAACAAAQPPRLPVATQTVDGVTLRITKARWGTPEEAVPGTGLGDPYAKVFAVWYEVQAQPGTAKPERGKELAHYIHAVRVLDPQGRTVKSTRGKGRRSRWWSSVDPRWETIRLEFEFLDPKAPPEATGEFDETLTFADVPAPPEPGKPFDVGRSLVTSLGTRVFLDAVGLATEFRPQTILFTRFEPSGQVPDLRTSLSLRRGSVVDAKGNDLTANGWGTRGGTVLGRMTDCVLIAGAHPTDGSKTLSVAVRVQESAASLKQERWFRKFAFELRLRDVALPTVQAFTPVAVHTDGAVDVTLESLDATGGGYTARLWLRDADAAQTPGREWVVNGAALSDDIETTYSAVVGWPDWPMLWKADGSPVLDGETGVRVSFGRSGQTAEPKALKNVHNLSARAPDRWAPDVRRRALAEGWRGSNTRDGADRGGCCPRVAEARPSTVRAGRPVDLVRTPRHRAPRSAVLTHL